MAWGRAINRGKSKARSTPSRTKETILRVVHGRREDVVDGRILHQIVEHVQGGLALLLVFAAASSRRRRIQEFVRALSLFEPLDDWQGA